MILDFIRLIKVRCERKICLMVHGKEIHFSEKVHGFYCFERNHKKIICSI